MATILNNKKSTVGGPYAYYTVEVTARNRLANSVTCDVKVKSHLQYDASFQGAGVTITGYVGINGVEHSITLKSSSETWSGTTVYTDTKTVTVTGLSETQTSVPTTFRVATSDDTSSLDSTACSNLTIQYYTAPEQPIAPALVDTSHIAVPYIFAGGTWDVSFARLIVTDDGNGNVTVAAYGSVSIADDGAGNVTVVDSGATTITDDGAGNVMIR